MVLNIGALKSGDYRLCERDVAAVVEASHRGGAMVKVIIEAALLTDDEKVKACVISKAAGADFVKTSTGFGPGGATAADVALMRRVVGPGHGGQGRGRREGPQVRPGHARRRAPTASAPAWASRSSRRAAAPPSPPAAPPATERRAGRL